MKPAFEPASFLNVDLEMGWKRISASRLDLLAAAIAPKTCLMFRGRIGALERLHVESSTNVPTLGRAFGALIRVIERLPDEAMRVWRAAAIRDFNVGVQAAGPEDGAFELAVDPPAARAVSALGGRIVFTIYPPIAVPKVRRRASH